MSMCQNLICRLAAEGYDEAADQVFKHILAVSDIQRKTAEQYLKNLISMGKPVANVIEHYKYLVKSNVIDADPTVLVSIASRFKQTMDAVDYLKFVIQEGRIITLQNFRTMFESCNSPDNVPAIYALLEVLADFPDT